MDSRNLISRTLLLMLFALVSTAAIAQVRDSVPEFDSSEITRRLQYPKENLKEGTQGYAVVKVHVNERGKVIESHISESFARATLKGKVVVRIWVDRDGKAMLLVIDSSDNKVFDAAAVEAVKKMRFTPAIDSRQKPVRAWITIPVKFQLS